MALYTAKGDDGSTTTFGSVQRISKDSTIAEALGTLDEVNSYLGMCKVQAVLDSFTLREKSVAGMVHELQDDMFIIQAELAGADKVMPQEKVQWLESLIKEIEAELPPITSFFIAGGTELASRFDFARTLARRAERRVVGAQDNDTQNVGKYTLAYLNRLSSILYALARLANYKMGASEDSPDYK